MLRPYCCHCRHRHCYYYRQHVSNTNWAFAMQTKHPLTEFRCFNAESLNVFVCMCFYWLTFFSSLMRVSKCIGMTSATQIATHYEQQPIWTNVYITPQINTDTGFVNGIICKYSSLIYYRRITNNWLRFSKPSQDIM